MPTVNFYYNSELNKGEKLFQLASDSKEYLAQELSCGEKKLTPGEISIRFIPVNGQGMIASVEVEITAHAFEDRVQRQDDICRNFASFIKNKLPTIGDVQVWLILCQLGHSWED